MVKKRKSKRRAKSRGVSRGGGLVKARFGTKSGMIGTLPMPLQSLAPPTTP